MRKKQRFLVWLIALSLCVSMLCVYVSASSAYGYDLETTGSSYDIGLPREKTDYNDADVIPSSGSNYSYGARYFINYVINGFPTGFRATGYTDRFNLNSFDISYKPTYAMPGTVRMGIYSYTQSTNYSVHVVGTWYP